MSGQEADLSHNLPEYTVSEISQALKRTVEQAYTRVRIKGEISGFKRAASGHRYMSLKDEIAVLDAVSWRGTALGMEPEDGLEVIVSGRLTTYPGRSKYQIIIEAMEIAGEGALLKLLEERRRKFTEAGLFDEARKKDLPYLPEVIGVVTSPTGAVIRDILHRLRDRFPRHVLLWPVVVQGEGAAKQIAAAIGGFNNLKGDVIRRPDILIIARGGGSLEDLWAFNEEIVIRAAAASKIPIISAVGHETDVTLIDFVADRRAPTPTAAAEIAVPVRSDLAAGIMDDGRRLLVTVSRMFEERRIRLEGLTRGLPDLVGLIGVNVQQIDVAAERLINALKGHLQSLSHDIVRLGLGLVDPGQQLSNASERTSESGHALEFAYKQRLRLLDDRLDGVRKRHNLEPLARMILHRRASLVDFAPRLVDAIGRTVVEAVAVTKQQSSLLESLSFVRVLERGYVVVRDAVGQPINRGSDTKKNENITLQFVDARIAATISKSTQLDRKNNSNHEGRSTSKKADPQQRLF